MARNLKIRDLTLRDGQQSSFATRMNQEQIDRDALAGIRHS